MEKGNLKWSNGKDCYIEVNINGRYLIIEKPLKDCIVPVLQEEIKNSKHIRNNQVIELHENLNKED